jgi:hypothetical protein
MGRKRKIQPEAIATTTTTLQPVDQGKTLVEIIETLDSSLSANSNRIQYMVRFSSKRSMPEELNYAGEDGWDLCQIVSGSQMSKASDGTVANVEGFYLIFKKTV